MFSLPQILPQGIKGCRPPQSELASHLLVQYISYRPRKTQKPTTSLHKSITSTASDRPPPPPPDPPPPPPHSCAPSQLGRYICKQVNTPPSKPQVTTQGHIYKVTAQNHTDKVNAQGHTDKVITQDYEEKVTTHDHSDTFTTQDHVQ